MNIFRISIAFFLAASICLVSCSKTGPAGPQGPQGEQGKQGEQGPQGIPGAAGSTIYSGSGSPAASIGQDGDYYLDKSTGNLYGPKTDNGWGDPVSLQGSQGDQGATGPQGPAGAQGPEGEQGAAGSQGPQGPQGEKGDPGTTGAQGPAGQNGKDGSQIISGTSAPADATGNIGDYYWDTSTFTLYGPKTSSGWGSGVLLQGPQGPKGDKGDTGNANVRTSGWTVLPYSWWSYNLDLDDSVLILTTDARSYTLNQNWFHVSPREEEGAILLYVDDGTRILLCPFQATIDTVIAGKIWDWELGFSFIINNRNDGKVDSGGWVCPVINGVQALNYNPNLTNYLPFEDANLAGIPSKLKWNVVVIPPVSARRSSPPPDPKDYSATCKYYGIPE